MYSTRGKGIDTLTHNMQELYLLDSQGLNLDKAALLEDSLHIMTLWGAKPTKQPNKHAHIRIVLWTFSNPLFQILIQITW